MTKPNYLKRASWSSVDLVDRPADAHARFSIWKRDSSATAEEVEKMSPTSSQVSQGGKPVDDDEEEMDEYGKPKKKKKQSMMKREFSADERRELAKKGQALPDGSFPIVNKSDLSNAVQAFGRAGDQGKAKNHIIKRARALGAVEMLPEDWRVSKSEPNKEEGAMPLTLSEEVRKGLPDDVQAYLTDLEAEVAKKDAPPEATTPETVAKRDDLPEDIKKMFSDQAEAIAKAESVAKAERDLRLNREWQDRIGKFEHLGLDEGVAKSFKELSDTDSELADTVVKALEGLNEKAEVSALFEEIGKSEEFQGTGEGKLESVVKSIQNDEKVSEPEAWDLASQRHPDLYERYLTEKGA